MTLGFMGDQNTGVGLINPAESGYPRLAISSSSYGTTRGNTNIGTQVHSGKTIGLSIDPAKSGIVADTSDLITSNMIIKY